MRIVFREGYSKCCALLQRTPALNGSVHQLSIFGNNMQPQAGTLDIGSIGGPEETFHQMLLIFF
jgi:hypothetical protein